MKLFLALVFMIVMTQNLRAEPTNAPNGSTWTKLESLGDFNAATVVTGYVEGSSVLMQSQFGFGNLTPDAKIHCIKSFYLMMEKPGKYQVMLNELSGCILKPAK
jgi:hypothetical protein